MKESGSDYQAASDMKARFQRTLIGDGRVDAMPEK